MPIAGDLLKVLPFGEENAVTSRLLWKHQGMWPVASIKHKLNEMAAARAYESALILEPLKMKGATGSAVAPIAIR